ncbi:Heat stress transcription factor B-4 [Linum grandiflorum]
MERRRDDEDHDRKYYLNNNGSSSTASCNEEEEEEIIMGFNNKDGGGGGGVVAAAVAPFLTKTYELVDDPMTDHIVSWGNDVDVDDPMMMMSTFVVWRPPEFARDLLPKYFKHNNFSSFVRQLNTYGFKKVVAERWEFGNDYFRKGAKQLLSHIHRRKTPHHHHHNDLLFQLPHHHIFLPPPQPSVQLLPATASNTYGSNWMTHNINPPLPLGHSDEMMMLSALSEDNRRLKKRNLGLLSELSHMKSLYNDIIYFIQNHLKPPSPHHHHHAPTTTTNNNNNNKLVELDPSDERDDDELQGGCSGAVKLFGVSLCGKKRHIHSDDHHHFTPLPPLSSSSSL